MLAAVGHRSKLKPTNNRSIVKGYVHNAQQKGGLFVLWARCSQLYSQQLLQTYLPDALNVSGNSSRESLKPRRCDSDHYLAQHSMI